MGGGVGAVAPPSVRRVTFLKCDLFTLLNHGKCAKAVRIKLLVNIKKLCVSVPQNVKQHKLKCLNFICYGGPSLQHFIKVSIWRSLR